MYLWRYEYNIMTDKVLQPAVKPIHLCIVQTLQNSTL